MQPVLNLSRTELARRLYEISHITGEFELRSGATSHEYFDKYLFESDPLLLKNIAMQLSETMDSGLFANAKCLAGLEMGGIPIATILSQETGIPSLFVRKVAKTHGTNKLAEGPEFTGQRVVIVEDVVSSGGQIIISTGDLIERGAIITDAICVIDRESGGREKLEDAGIALHALFTMTELKQHLSA
jgi:orotate phosphoribosyltransferase